MPRYKCIVSYDGTQYMGFQIQEELPTIELSIKKALKQLLNENVKIFASGRTDRFVHAKGQVFHFDTKKNIPALGIKNGLNAFLPEDIFIKDVTIVDESFHARFSATSKEYRYYIKYDEYDPLKIHYASFISNLNIDKMIEGLNLLKGTHDFKGFASASIDSRKDTVKTIFDAHVNFYPGYYEFVFVGTGFLKYQIRRMMGLLIEIGRGKEKPEMVSLVLEKADPSISHKVADGCGLYLMEVHYNQENK